MGALVRAVSASAAAAKQVPEAERVAETAENVFEANEGRRIEACALACQTGVPVAVVGGALLRVREHGVGFSRLLELLFGVLAALVPIGVELECQPPVGGLQLALGRVPCDAEHFVEIAPRHACATFTIAGRRSRSPST